MYNNADLPPVQREVLALMRSGEYTIKQIAHHRQTSLKAVYKTVAQLKKKGMLNGGVQNLGGSKEIEPPTNKGQNHKIRLHSQAFKAKLIYKSPRYVKLHTKTNVIYPEGHAVRLYKDSVVVYCKADHHFWGMDEQKATAISINYWTRYFYKLEQLLGVIIIKGPNTRIKQFRAHYAQAGNELAKDCNKKGIKVFIYGKDDGKLWFTIDNSYNLNEAETLHPIDAEADMSKIRAVFQDFRQTECLTPLELQKHVGQLSMALNEQINNNMAYFKNIESHVAAIKQLGKGVNKLTKLLDKIERRLK